MDEVESLDALAAILTELSENPYDLSLHAKHIALAQKHGLQDQLHVARDMLVGVYAGDEDIWTPMIEYCKSQEDLVTPYGVGRVLEMYTRAEEDYLSIPLLESHARFVVEVYTSHADQDQMDSGPFSAQWALSVLRAVLLKSSLDIVHSHRVWTVVQDWFSEVLESSTANVKATLVPDIESILLLRLRQAHSNNDETFQVYSSFTTKHQPTTEYEKLLVAASKARSAAVKLYQRREKNEANLARSNNSLEAFHQYITYERRARHPDKVILQGVSERAIAEAAQRRSRNEPGAPEALATFWIDYLDDLRRHGEEAAFLETIFRRALRSVPGCAEVWARYIRFLEQQEGDDNPDVMDTETEAVADAYSRAIATQLMDSKPDELIPLVLARAGYERRQIAKNENVEEIFLTLVQTLEGAISQVRSSPTGDSRFRLERFLATLYATLADSADSSTSVWQATAQHYKTSYLAWQTYIDALIKQDRHDDAREVFKDIVSRNLDWPEAIWEAWLSFEHAHGSLDELEFCMDQVKRTQAEVNFRRAKEAQKIAYQASASIAHQAQPELGTAAADDISTAHVNQIISEAVSTNNDEFYASSSRVKRKAEEEPAERVKKAKIEVPSAHLKRDRENCTVFVANLPSGCEEAELNALFKDCGEIRELKLTQLPGNLVATVEFAERDSVSGALTKDKKRIRGEEVAVHLAWQSTLYVTNFPEGTDDPAMRNLFGAYGTIFDVRWPSKKFKSTRRFCYVQFISPDSARAALVLNGNELEAGLSLNVYISNPERKKERTDAGADQKEIYVAGLSRFTKQTDLQKLFKTYGAVKEVRIEMEKEGQCKGFAFVEFEEETSAAAALSANNHELKGRRIAVTIADARRSRKRAAQADTGLGLKADTRSRSIRLGNVPQNAQEGLLQQQLEKFHKVKRLEIFYDKREAIVEFESAAAAGQMLLNLEPFVFEGETLTIREEGQDAPGNAPRTAGPASTMQMFAPRTAGRPKVGLGKPRTVAPAASASTSVKPKDVSQVGSAGGKGQDDFRKLLG